jgi:molecular chaperone DnaJ
VRVSPHKFFRRREYDILMDLNINIAQATLGAEVEIPTVDGPAKLKIPTGIQPGKVLRLRGKGVPQIRGNGRGDQMVVVNVEIPRNLTGEQRKLIEQLATSLGSEVSPAERGFLDWLKDTLGG